MLANNPFVRPLVGSIKGLKSLLKQRSGPGFWNLTRIVTLHYTIEVAVSRLQWWGLWSPRSTPLDWSGEWGHALEATLSSVRGAQAAQAGALPATRSTKAKAALLFWWKYRVSVLASCVLRRCKHGASSSSALTRPPNPHVSSAC